MASLAIANPTQQPDLRMAQLKGANLRWADLRGAGLTGVDLSGADLSDADLSDATIGWTIFANVDLSRVKGSTPFSTMVRPRLVSIPSTNPDQAESRTASYAVPESRKTFSTISLLHYAASRFSSIPVSSATTTKTSNSLASCMIDYRARAFAAGWMKSS